MPFEENIQKPLGTGIETTEEFIKNPRDTEEPLRKETFSQEFTQLLDIGSPDGDHRLLEGEESTAVKAIEVTQEEFGPLEPFWSSIEKRYAHNYSVFIRSLLNGLCDRVSETMKTPRAFLRLMDFRTDTATDFIFEYVSPKWRRYNFGGVAKRLLRFIYTYGCGESGLLDPRLAQSLSRLYESLYHQHPGSSPRDLGSDDPEPVKKYRAHLDARGVRRDSNDIYTIREFIDWWIAYKRGREFRVSEVTVKDIWAFRAYLLGRNVEGPTAPRRKPGTTSAMLNHIKGWFRYLSTRGGLSVDPTDGVASIPSEAHEKPRYLDIDACVRFLKALVRNATEPCLEMAMFLVIMSTGMRPAEAAGLKVKAISVTEGFVTFRRKKSGKDATLPLPPIAVLFLRVWLQAHPRPEDGDASLWTYKGRPMSIEMLQARFKIYRDAAGIPASVGGAHVFRHTLASHLVKETSLEVLQQIFGHFDQWTLSFYLHLMEGLDKLMVAWGRSVMEEGVQDDC